MPVSRNHTAGATTEHGVPHIATYRRELPVTLERLYENAIDWAHLPYLHSSTFARVDCLQAGDWGFRARIWQRVRMDGQPLVVELRLQRECRCWITSTIDGPGRGTEIWTHAFPLGERRTEVAVDFYVPTTTKARVEVLREFFVQLYTRLYDEDVWMMTIRQERLDALKQPGGQAAKKLELGPLDELRERLPLVFALGGRSFRLVELNEKLVAHSIVCPHMLGPLEVAEFQANGVIQCPWHGYRFDLNTRRCLSNGHWQLAPAPMVQVDPITSTVTVAL